MGRGAHYSFGMLVGDRRRVRDRQKWPQFGQRAHDAREAQEMGRARQELRGDGLVRVVRGDVDRDDGRREARARRGSTARAAAAARAP